MSRKVNRWKNILIVPALGVLLLAGGAGAVRLTNHVRRSDHTVPRGGIS